MAGLRMAALLAAGTSLCACASAPSMQIADKGQDHALPSHTIDEVLCEVKDAGGFTELTRHSYAMSFNLTMEAKDGAGLTPSFGFIKVLHGTSKTLTHTVGGEISGSRLRNYTNNFTVPVSAVPVLISERQVDCKPDRDHWETSGHLKLNDVINAGLASAAGFEKANVEATSYPAFGGEAQFASTRSIKGGPAWSETHFTGPGGDGGLVNASRTDTNTLTIAFAPPEAKGKSFLSTVSPEGSAAISAQAFLNQMILQQINRR